MGTPDFAVSALDALCAAGQQVVLAVTQPDKQKGRGRKVIQTPVKMCAEKWGVPVFQPVKIREADAIEKIRSLAPDLIVVAAGAVLMFCVSLWKGRRPLFESINAKPVLVRGFFLWALILIAFVFGVYGIGFDASKFIYNQF